MRQTPAARWSRPLARGGHVGAIEVHEVVVLDRTSSLEAVQLVPHRLRDSTRSEIPRGQAKLACGRRSRRRPGWPARHAPTQRPARAPVHRRALGRRTVAAMSQHSLAPCAPGTESLSPTLLRRQVNVGASLSLHRSPDAEGCVTTGRAIVGVSGNVQRRRTPRTSRSRLASSLTSRNVTERTTLAPERHIEDAVAARWRRGYGTLGAPRDSRVGATATSAAPVVMWRPRASHDRRL